MKLFRSLQPRTATPRSPAPSEGGGRGPDLSARIEPFTYPSSPTPIPVQSRNLSSQAVSPAPVQGADPILTAPTRRQSLRARSSSEDPWVMINDGVQGSGGVLSAQESRTSSIASLMPGAAAPYNSPQFTQAITAVPGANTPSSHPSSPTQQQQRPQGGQKRPPNPSNISQQQPFSNPPVNPSFSNPSVNGHVSQGYPDSRLMESQESVREGSIHSQQDKSWTRNFFGGTGGLKEKEANAELMRMIGFLTAAAPDDWNLVLEVCERASANESAAKEAARALRREFKYGEPSAQLSAARLWAIMLQNAQDVFILQSASRKFLDNLEEVILAEGTSPVVRERLLDVLASAAYEYGKKPGKEGFTSLWKRVRPNWKPLEGVPFDPQDMMFDSAFPRRAAPPGQAVPQAGQPVQQQQQQQTETRQSHSDRDRQQPHSDRSERREERDRDRRREKERDKYYQQQRQFELAQQHQVLRTTPTPPVPSRRERGIIPPEEDIRKLFEECDVARNNAQILSQALMFASPSTLGSDSVIQEFHAKCRASQELIVAQIPWASAGAERSRAAAAAKRKQDSSSDGGANGKLVKRPQRSDTVTQNGVKKDAAADLTKEERLLAALLQANEETIEVFRVYEELEKMAFSEMEEREIAKRSMVETRLDRTQIHLISPDGAIIDAPAGPRASSSSRSPSPMPVTSRSPPPVTIPPVASGKRDLPLPPPPSANEHMTPPISVPANLSQSSIPSPYHAQPSPLSAQAIPGQQIPLNQHSPPPNHPPTAHHHAHHASNHSVGGYGNLNLPPAAPVGPRHSPSTRSRTPSPDRPGLATYAGNTPPTTVTPNPMDYGPPPHPPPHIAARNAVTGGARVDSLRRTESPVPGHAPPGLAVGGGGVHNVAGVRIDLDAAKGYMNEGDNDLMTPVQPSEKALGKRRAAIEEPPNEEELERQEEAELEEAFLRSTAPPGTETEEPQLAVKYIYDAAAERARELDLLEKEEKEKERLRREQLRSSVQRVPGAGGGSGGSGAAAAGGTAGAGARKA